MRPTVIVLFTSIVSILACSGGEAEPPPPPPPVPTDPPRSERTGPVEPANLAVLQQAEAGCNFYVSVQPGDGVAPIARLPGECPVWLEVAYEKGRMVVLADGVPMEIVKREVTVMPEPEHSSAIGLRGDQIVVCGSGDETWKEKDGKVTFDFRGKTYDAPKTEGATDYALARRYVWTSSKWEQEAIGVVPVFSAMSDAACTGLLGWPGEAKRLDPSQSRWKPDDWTTAIQADADPLSGIAIGEWHVDPTRTVAVRGKWTESTFTPEGPVALWVAGAWKPVEGTAKTPLVFTLAPDWLLYDVEDGQSRLVSRRDGTESWGDQTDGPVFLWPADLPVPAERGDKPKRDRGGDGDARERRPRHGRPDGRPGQPAHPDHPGHRPGDGKDGKGGKGGKGGKRQ